MALLRTPEALGHAVQKYIDQGEPFAFDVETMGPGRDNPLIAQVYWVSLANSQRSDVIPMNFPNGELLSERQKPNKKGTDRMARGVAYEDLNPKYDLLIELERTFGPPPEHMDRAEVMSGLEPLFTSPYLLKIGHNIKFDIHSLNKYFGGGIQGPFFDTMIASWLIDSRRVTGKNTASGGLSLKDCVKRELGYEVKKGIGDDISQHCFEDVRKYSLIDAEATHDLWWSLRDHFKGALGWLMDLEMSVLYPVLEMEQSGVRIDKEVLRTLASEIMVDTRDIEEWFRAIPGYKDFNIRSNRQKQELLFTPKKEGGLGIRSAKLTPGGEAKKNAGEPTDLYDLSVDNSVLEAHRRIPAVGKLLDYSQASKIYGTYVQPYLGGESLSGGKPKVSQLRDGRIYGQFKQSGTESGRFSSANPNLQNIPSRSPRGKRVREAFLPNEHETLIVADYSQIEPRIIASLSQDPTMLKAYLAGEDVYQTVADRMKVGRSAGKTLVLAIAYGVGPTKISTDIGCSYQDARELMDFFNRSFPRIIQHKRRVLLDAKKDGYSQTIFGRRRYLDFKHPNEAVRAMAERQAYNHLIQGSAADVMKIALVNVHAALPSEATMLMTVHDEIVVSAPEHMAEDVKMIIKEEMEASCPSRFITVPLVAEVETGRSWADCK